MSLIMKEKIAENLDLKGGVMGRYFVLSSKIIKKTR